MPQGMTTATEILKEVFIPGIVDQLENEPTTYNKIKSSAGNAEKFGGKWVEFPIHIERNTGIGARSENDYLPDAGQQKFRESRLNLKSFYGAIELSGQVFDLATKDYQGFSSLVKEETDGLATDLMVDRNRQVHGNGSGILGTVVSLAGQVITLASNNDVYRFQDGMKIDVMAGNTVGIRQAKLTVTDIDPATNKVTFTGTPTGIVAGDVITRQGNYGKEWTGLDAIINDTNPLYGIDPTNTATGSRLWRGQVNNNGGTPTAISEASMARMADRLKFQGGGKTTMILSTPGVFRAYWQLLKSERQFVNTKDFGGGYKGLSFDSPNMGEIPFFSDDQANYGSMYFVNEKDLTIYRPYEYKLIDRGGSTWHQKSDGTGVKDVWQAWMVEHSEIGCKRRNAHGKITNILEDAY